MMVHLSRVDAFNEDRYYVMFNVRSKYWCSSRWDTRKSFGVSSAPR